MTGALSSERSHRPVSSIATFRDRLPLGADLCQPMRMSALAALRRFLCLLALLGVVVAPVSVGTSTSAMAASDMRMEAMASMDVSEDMSCCPQQQLPRKNDCGSPCPLGLICAGSVLAHADRAEGWGVHRDARGASHTLLHDSELSSATIDPPARPPKA
ncbi:hypothetical protein [Sinorhizobium arboris]|uniref:hypothetical protein n=1 Tax=Sinorhizobium arboris TaxID=76745 RepID=UPI000519BFF2|nr:hypothetical protein [Sinorhizobium arboris]